MNVLETGGKNISGKISKLTANEFLSDYVVLGDKNGKEFFEKTLKDYAFISTGVQIGIGGTRTYENIPIDTLFYSEIKKEGWFNNISLKSTDFYSYCTPKTKNYINLDEELAYRINKNVKKCNIAVTKVVPFLNKEKIFVRQSSPKITATIGGESFVSEYSAFMLVPTSNLSLYCLLGLLNSRYVTTYALKNRIILTGEKKQPQIRLSELKKIPIPTINEREENTLSSLVKSCIDENDETRKNGLIERIDSIVDSIYQKSMNIENLPNQDPKHDYDI